MDNILSFDYKKYYESEEWKKKKCDDEVIGYLNIDNKDINFHLRDDYENVFVELKDHNDYFDSKRVEIKGKIVVILESPHIAEFKTEDLIDFSTNNKITSRPANNSTGINLRNLFNAIFSDSICKLEMGNGNYSISLINSIQNQCSLGTDTNFYRDRIWTRCWFEINEYKNDFIQRLQSLKPDLILNCATVGSHYRISDDKSSKEYDTTKLPLDFTKLFLTKEYDNTIPYLDTNANIQKIITESILEELKCNREMIIHSTHPSSWRYSKNRKIKTYEEVGINNEIK